MRDAVNDVDGDTDCSQEADGVTEDGSDCDEELEDTSYVSPGREPWDWRVLWVKMV